jgi:sulfopyruvate decarboxylase subunit alpha
MLTARSVMRELEGCGVGCVAGLPDNSSAGLIALLRREKTVRFVEVTREGEAFGVASGYWIGGGEAAVLIQNTGLLESGDALRGTAQRMRIPLLCFVTYRGYGKMPREVGPAGPETWEAGMFSQAAVDSAALVTEPTLRAWGVPFDFLGSDADLPKIREAFARAKRESRPVALLVTADMV